MKRRWSSTEDELLISAWLNTNKNAIVGTDKKGGAFWKRIEQYYMENKPASGVPRISTQCKHRWQKISQSVSKFVGCYEQAKQQKCSGQSSADVYNIAKKIYSNDGHGKEFLCDHAWHLLRNEPKWMESYVSTSQSSGGGSKRTKINEAGGYSSNSNPTPPHSVGDDESPLVRAICAKASKKKGKQVRRDECEEVVAANEKVVSRLDRIVKTREERLKQKTEQMQELIEIKKMENETKKTENETKKIELLIMLLSKGETLSVAEQRVKDTLLEKLF